MLAQIYNQIDTAIKWVDDRIWGLPLIILILTTGIYLTVRLGGLQIRHLPKALRFMVKNEEEGHGEVTSFGALCTALSATIGTGNITGVATAIAAGGPGALFWMVVAAFFGMATKYAEGLLAIKYRTIDKEGHVLGGPFYYIENGMGKNWRWLAKIFAFFGAGVGLFGIGTFTQVNSIASAVKNFFDPNTENAVQMFGNTYSWATVITCIILTVCVGLVVIGGLKRIAKVSEIVVPFMAVLYVVFVLIIMITHITEIPAAIVTIVKSAFTGSALAGGAMGTMVVAMQKGIARGIFSNEAGLGTLAVLHGPAEHTTPWEQGMWAMFEVFFDTVVLCTLTALVILCTSQGDIETFSLTGAALAAACFSARSGIVGKWFISVSMVVFAFATVIAWYYLGQQAVVYLKEKTGILHLHILYPILFLLAVFAGGCIRLEAIWMLSDLWNGLMAFFNLTALLFLSGEVCIPDHSDLFNTTKKTPHVK